MSNRKQGPSFLTAEWHPDIVRGVITIFLVVFAILSVLSFFESAGLVGIFLGRLLSILFGVIRFVVPVMLIIVAVLVVRNIEYDYQPTHGIGFFLFFLSLNGIIHLFVPLEEMVDTALRGLEGGLFGLVLSWPLMHFTGFWASFVILAALLLVSFLFLFNTSLARIIELHKVALRGLGRLGDVALAFPRLFKRKSGSAITIKGDYEETSDAPSFERKSIDEETEEEEEDEEEENEEDEADEEDVEEDEDTETDSDESKDEMKPTKKPTSYKPPPAIDLLFNSASKPTSGDIKANAEVIRDTLANFGIEVDMGEIRVGPTVTQYSLKPARGVKLSRITALSNDLALALAAHPIRIEAPIPGQSLVGIEVPNQRVALVSLRELLSSKEFVQRANGMQIALGKDVAGKVWFADLPRMPHLLLAGATGSGKTVCMNVVILSLLFQNTPETLRFIMVDPKRVELTPYNGIPHLLTPVITDVQKTISALKWCIGEMDRRFDLLSKVGSRDIISYNKKASEPLPYIVFLIDELADLMSSAGAEIEAGIIRIAQMARAVGIHLVLATQRPSTDVITGLIKANIPGRIAFSVAALVDSRTILDSSGAEKLLGRGDMLFMNAELSKPKRIQGAFISEEEMKRVIEYLKTDEPPVYDESVVDNGVNGPTSVFGKSTGSTDPIFLEAKKIIIESGKASASFLQRRLKLGYARAARILDELEAAGVVGPADGAKPREILVRDMEDAEILEDKQYFDGEKTDENEDGESKDEENVEEGEGEENNKDFEEDSQEENNKEKG